jgi:quercetin dioxygenase-like cupin family protein
MNDQVSFEVDGVEEQSKAYAVTGRKWIARSPTLTVMEFTLAPNEEVPLHYHSDTYDIFYCIEGSMRVECVDVETGKEYDEQVLNVGDSAKVPAKIAHRPYNPGPERCRFVIVQGFNKKDFLMYRKPEA